MTAIKLPHGAAAITLLGAAIAANAASLQEIFKQAAPSVLALEAVDAGGKVVETNSAIVTGPDSAITRCGVVDAAPVLRLIVAGQARAASIGARDEARDLCRLRADLAGAGKPFSVADMLPAAGTPVIAVTQGFGAGALVSTGVVAALRHSGARVAIQFSAPIAPGATGGALLDEQGRLLGVIDYRLRDGQNVNFAAPARWIAEVEQRAEAQRDLADTKRAVTQLVAEKDWQGMLARSTEWTRRLPDDAEAWTALGVAQLGLEQAPAAEISFRRALGLDPEATRARAAASFALRAQNKFAEARALLQEGLAVNRESAVLWEQLGAVELALGKPDAARSAYETVLTLNPWSYDATLRLGNLAQQRGDLAGALDNARRYAALRPDSVDAWLHLADTYLAAARPRRALAATEQAVALAGESGDTLYFRARVALAEARFADAIRLARESLDQAPRYASLVHAIVGDACYRASRFPEAIAAFREAYRLNPQNAHARDWLMVALKDNNQSDQALAMLEPLAKSDPDNPFFWRQIGMNRYNLGNFDGAVEAFRRGLTADPKQPRMLGLLTEAAWSAGRKDEALAAYETLRGMDAKLAELTWARVIRAIEAER
ncbi:MAG: tetratricopeptide repeat protein [Rhodocyclaceae bacterium]|nr:tetratricopeptide repeat protein [Rhodocyclaceae bacterium]